MNKYHFFFCIVTAPSRDRHWPQILRSHRWLCKTWEQPDRRPSHCRLFSPLPSWSSFPFWRRRRKCRRERRQDCACRSFRSLLSYGSESPTLEEWKLNDITQKPFWTLRMRIFGILTGVLSGPITTILYENTPFYTVINNFANRPVWPRGISRNFQICVLYA